MKKPLKLLAPIAVGALPLVALSFAATPASAAQDDSGSNSYQVSLDPLNDSGGSGMFTVTLNGDQATVSGHASGLADTFQDGPYPHAQHIHIGGDGTCPTPSADKNDDGIVDTAEGQDAYGMVDTSLTTKGDSSADSAVAVKRFPGGGSYDYERTFTMSDKSQAALKDGSAVLVVHGLDPSNLSKEAQDAKSNLDDSLPLAATAPALCGTFTKAPSGAPQTGDGSTAGTDHLGLFSAGGAMIVLGGSALLWSRQRKDVHADSPMNTPSA